MKNFFRDISLRKRLFLSYFSILLINFVIIFCCINVYDKRDRLLRVYVKMESVTLKTSQSVAAEQNFLLNDMYNENFYRTGHSDYLRQRKALIAGIYRDIRSIHAASRHNAHLTPQIDTIMMYIAVHEKLFNDVLDSLRVRGFLEYGIEGRMRRYAHQLESMDQLRAASILQLRRREKDFLLRKDTIYVGLFDSTAASLLSNVDKKSREAEVLQDYIRYFKRLVQMEYNIGVNNNTGLRKRLQEESQLVQAHTERTIQDLRNQYDKELEQLKTSFIILVLLAVCFGIVLCAIFAHQITKPIITLDGNIKQIIHSDFKNPSLPDSNPSRKDEISTLYHNFGLMATKIHHDFMSLEKKNAELQDANERLRINETNLQNANALKDKFLSIISHDMRGPLVNIVGFMELFRENTESFSMEELITVSGNLSANVKQVVDMLDSLLLWSRSQSGEMKPDFRIIDASEVIKYTITVLGQSAGAKEISIYHELEPAMVLADENMLAFIVRNLLSNAIKFSRRNSSIAISVHTHLGRQCIRIRDEGVGMDAITLDKLFIKDENISTAGTEKEKGIGLGLLLCNDFVRNNGGALSVQSEKDKGTTVTVCLPMAAAARQVTAG
ncbi:MAG TPA: HAMP domain-containing sensor histidine kinase [Chitinophaga sp.]